MSDRVTVTVNATPSAAPATGTPSGRYFIVGRTSTGPSDGAVIVNSLTEFRNLYGSRNASYPQMYDAVQLAKNSGAGQIVVMRATGSAAAQSSDTLDTLTVKAKYVGSYADGWTLAYTAATKTLVLTAGGVTETYTGTDITSFLGACANSPRIVVTGAALPAADETGTLAGGGDDYANLDSEAEWDAVFTKIDAGFGPGAVATPGVQTQAAVEALATHCATNYRIGLVAAAQGAAAATAASAVDTVKLYDNSEYLTYVWPWIQVADLTTGTRYVDPVSFAAGLRARAHAVAGPGDSPIQEIFARSVVGVTPELACSSADFATLRNKRVSVIRSINGTSRLYSWLSLEPLGGNTNLLPAQYRDVLNFLAHKSAAVCEGYVGRPASTLNLGALRSELNAVLSVFSGTYLSPRYSGEDMVDPGYAVEVSTGANPADNTIEATLSLRLSESVEFVTVVINAGDANVNF